MEIKKEVENKIEVKNTVNNEILNEESVKIEEKQNSFLESTLGKVINTGVDIALRAILPNMIEDEVIRNKKCNFEWWISRRYKNSNKCCNKYRKKYIRYIYRKIWYSITSIFSSEISDGIIDSASKIVDTAVKSAQDNNLIKSSTAKVIKKSKNVIKDCISSKIEENFMEQVDGVEKIGKYINNWNTYLNQRDLAGMKRE